MFFGKHLHIVLEIEASNILTLSPAKIFALQNFPSKMLCHSQENCFIESLPVYVLEL